MSFIKIADSGVLESNIEPAKALVEAEITERFIKLAKSIKKVAPRSDDFMYFSTIMLTAAEAALIDQKTGEPKKDKNGNVITGGFDDKWRWHCSDPTIKPYANQNRDIFGETELKKAYKGWIGKGLFKNHESSDVESMRGIIIDCHYDDKFKRVVGLIALDRKTYPDLAHKVKSGIINSVSMGTAVAKAICLECGNSASVEAEYCSCMRQKKGEINVGLSPIELSLVTIPADPQAKVLKIIASMNNYVDQRNSLLEEKERVETEKLNKLDASIQTVQTQLNRLFSECSDNSCQFVKEANGHIKMVKSAQKTYTWEQFFDIAKHVDSADDYEKHDLFDKLNEMRPLLKTEDLRKDPKLLMEFVDVMASKNKYLHQTILQPVLEALKSTEQDGQISSMQDHQFTSPNGPDKDLGLDGTEVTLPANEQQTGGRVSKMNNPSETGIKPDKGGDTGPELGSASDRFQFGNMASWKNNVLKAKGDKITTADIEENLNLLLKQTQEIETEMNKMKETLYQNTTNNTTATNDKVAMEELKMNEARLKLRAKQRQALLEKVAGEGITVNAELHCKKCGAAVENQKAAKVHAETAHKGEDVVFTDMEKKSYWQGTTEPTPGKPQYKPENGGEPKTRMNDKQMHQDKSMGGAEGAFPGDEKLKKEHLRADLEERAMKRRAYWQGTTEPTPGKPQYKPENGGEPKTRMNDKQMHQDKSMGGAEGAFPGDEKLKKEHLRAELAPGVLRTKFSKVRNVDGSYDKKASYFEVFAGENKLLKATAEEIYGDELDKPIEGANGKTGWEVLCSQEYGKEVMAAIRSEGFEKVATMLKGAQAAPELPPAMEAPAAPAPAAEEAKPEDTQKKEVDVNAVMSLLGEAEDKLEQLKSEVTGENEGEVKDMSVEPKDEDADAAKMMGEELTANLHSLGREVVAELDRSADELALVVEYLNKSASLSADKKAELDKLAADAVADGKDLIEEADVILSIAGKVPAGLKAYQEKQKGKEKDEKEDKKDKSKDKDKKEDKKDKEKKEDKKDKKKSKKAEVVEALLKLAQELGSDKEEATAAADELDKEMKELGLMPEDEHKADDKDACGMCGMAMDKEHQCTASAKNQLVREALANRRAKREALLKAAEEKKYDVTPDTHGLESEAHPGGGTTTQLDVKPAGAGAKVETIDETHKDVMDAAEAAPTGKQGAAEVQIKEAVEKTAEEALKAELEAGVKAKKAEADKAAYRVKLRRSYDLALAMQDKGMIPRTKQALDAQVDEVIKFDDQAFESFKRAVANTQAVVKTASKVPQVGVREDNTTPDEQVTDVGLTDLLKKMW